MQYLRRNRYFLLFFLAIFLLAGCHHAQLPEEQTETAKMENPFFKVTKEDALTEYAEECTVIDLSQETNLEISEGGQYLLKGDCTGGITIQTDDQNVHLFLDGVNVRSNERAALNIISAGKVFITALNNSVNEFSDAPGYRDDLEEDACMYSNCNLTLNGSGTIHVVSKYGDGIHCKDTLKIFVSNMYVQGKKEGIKANDGLLVKQSTLRVEAEQNAIQTTKIGKKHKGAVEILQSDLTCIGGKYALNVVDDLQIEDSSVYLKGIYGDYKVDGTAYIGEGCLENE